MVTVYGIPSCGTVKKANAWLSERNVDHTFVDFRATPVGESTIAGWVAALGSKALRNTSGGSYRALPDDKKTWDDRTWITRFVADPMLIKRPVIVVNGAPVQAGFRTTAALEAAL